VIPVVARGCRNDTPVVIPAGRQPAPKDAFTFIAGGPGGAATSLVFNVATTYASLPSDLPAGAAVGHVARSCAPVRPPLPETRSGRLPPGRDESGDRGPRGGADRARLPQLRRLRPRPHARRPEADGRRARGLRPVDAGRRRDGRADPAAGDAPPRGTRACSRSANTIDVVYEVRVGSWWCSLVVGSPTSTVGGRAATRSSPRSSARIDEMRGAAGWPPAPGRLRRSGRVCCLVGHGAQDRRQRLAVPVAA
jgi:hypothetical protein